MNRLRRRAAVIGVLALVALTTGAPALAQDLHTADPLPDNTQSCLPPPHATDATVPWAQQQLAPQQVWPLTEGAGVTVAVVDTGVDAQTPQLLGRVLPGADVINPAGGHGNSDCYGHGTFVAGIIAAAPADGTGFAGVAPEATILPIRAANTADDGTASTLAQGIRAAVDAGAEVINVSASTNAPSPDLLNAVNYAEAHNVVLVASAANGAQDGDPVTYPASYPTVLAVGAVDSTGAHADFSQTGPYLGLVAPGVDVVSIGPGGPGQWQGSGTSYAAPFVAGIAALVRAYHPGLSARQVRHRLETTADHPAATLPDPDLGWGEVNPMAAVTAVLPGEGTAAAPMVRPAPARHPRLPPRDSLGLVLTVLGLFGVLGLAFAVRMLFRLGPLGNRGRWRRRRVVRVIPDPEPERTPGAHRPETDVPQRVTS